MELKKEFKELYVSGIMNLLSGLAIGVWLIYYIELFNGIVIAFSSAFAMIFFLNGIRLIKKYRSLK